MKKINWRFFCFCFILSAFLTTQISAQCSTENVLDIPDLTPVSAALVVNGAVNNDLSSIGQGVCGLALEFEHSHIGDLTIELSSPDGQTVTLLGPTGSFGNTTFTDWNVLFVPCAQAPNPDAGFLDKWNNNQNWGLLGDYSGSYHPYLGCLEDFDTGTVDGIWNISILDNTQFDLGKLLSATIFFCDPTGLSCNTCEAYAGEFEEDEINVCINSADNINLTHSYPDGEPTNEYTLHYLVKQGEDILEINTILDLSSYEIGDYQISAITLNNEDLDEISSLIEMSYTEALNVLEGDTPTVCGDISDKLVEVSLTNTLDPVDLNITICEGTIYSKGGQDFSIPDTYEVTVTNPGLCDSIFNLTLSTVNIEANVTSNSTIISCTNTEIVIDGGSSIGTNSSIFEWVSSGGAIVGATDQESINVNQAGTYTLNLIDGNCISSESIMININDDVPELTLVGGTITCANPTVLIDLESDVPLASISWSGPNSFMSMNEDVTVSDPGVYTVTVESENGCVASKSIIINEAGEIPVLQLSAENISCSQPQVSINVEASSSGLTYSWTGPNSFTFEGKNPIVSEAGIYEVIATDPFGCSDVFSVEVFGNSEILDYELIYQDLICPTSDNTFSVEIDDPNAFIQWELPDNSILNGSSIISTQTGEFTVTILSNGCSTDETFTINEDFGALPVVELLQSNIIDCENPTAILTANILENENNIALVEWRYLGGKLNEDYQVEVNIGGQYSFFVFTLDGCVLRYNIILELNTQEVPVVIVELQNLTCANTETYIEATSTSNLEYSWTGPNSFTSNDSLISNIETGSYFLTVTDASGCTREYLSIMSADTIPPPLNLVSSDILDCDSDTSYIQPSYPLINNISWTSNNGFTGSTYEIKVTEPGFYYIEAVSDINGCTVLDTIGVFADYTLPDLEVFDQSFVCGQNSLILEANSTSTDAVYSWTGPNMFESNTQNPLVTEAGVYEVTVTKLNGCSVSQIINVTENNTLPDVDASFSNNLDCVFTQSEIIGTSSTSDVSFVWSGPNNFVSDQPVVTIEVAGDYTFYVTGSNNCVDSVTINVPFTGSFPEFEALGDTLFCDESETFIDVDQITPDVSYTWTGPNNYTSGDAFNMVVDSGLYIVTGIGSNNCITVDSSYVVFDNQDADFEVSNLIDTLDCNVLTQSINISTDKAFISTSWTGPNSFMSDDQDIIVEEGGTYQFTGVSANNCEVTLDVDIIQDIAVPDFSLIGEDLNCDNTKALITLDLDDAGATYDWSGPNFYSSDVQNTIVEEEGSYDVVVTGSNGCSETQSIEIFSDFEEPEITVKNDTLPCDGSPIVLFLETLTDDVTFQWVGPNGFDSISQNPLTDVPGTYFIEVKGPNGCSVNEIIEIKDIPVFPKYELNKSNEITCDTRSVTLTALDVADDKTFTWTTPEGEEIFDESFESINSGFYYFEIEGNTGCVVLDSIEVKLDTLYPTIEINQTGILLCEIDQLSISGEGSSEGVEFKYEWSTENGTIEFGTNSLNPVIQGEGTYQLYVEDESNGCGFSKEIVIEEEESTLEEAVLALDKQTCSGILDGVIEIVDVEGGFAPYRYAIAGTSFSQINRFENLESGEYLVSIKDTFGCVLDTLIKLDAEKDIDVDLGDDLDIDLGESVNLEALTNFPTNQIDSLVWTPNQVIDCIGCLSYEFIPETNIQVTIFIKDNDGCTTSDQIVIRVDETVNLYIPNIFTPNGDGVNDIWSISESSNVMNINYFNIYDRWGSKVYGDEDFIPGTGKIWDGRHNGVAVQQGVFVYIAELEMVNGKKRIIKGNITVQR